MVFSPFLDRQACAINALVRLGEVFSYTLDVDVNRRANIFVMYSMN